MSGLRLSSGVNRAESLRCSPHELIFQLTELKQLGLPPPLHSFPLSPEMDLLACGCIWSVHKHIHLKDTYWVTPLSDSTWELQFTVYIYEKTNSNRPFVITPANVTQLPSACLSYGSTRTQIPRYFVRKRACVCVWWAAKNSPPVSPSWRRQEDCENRVLLKVELLNWDH